MLIKQITILKTIILLSIITTFITCPSAPQQKELEDVDETYLTANRLVYLQTGLTLPAGWNFRQPAAEDNEGVILRFNNSEKTIFGSYEYVVFDFEIDAERVAQYYSDEILTGYQNKQISKISLSDNTAYIISAQHDEKGIDTLLVIIPEIKKVVNIIELISEKGYLSSNPELVYPVFQSYTYENKDKSIRTIKDCLQFYCYDGKWTWLDDYERGFYIMGKLNEIDCVVGIWEVDYKNTSELLNETGDFDLTGIEASFFINNLSITTEGIGQQDDNGFTKLYYIINYHEKNYCIFISIPNNELSIKPEEIHKHEAIENLFKYNLIFN